MTAAEADEEGMKEAENDVVVTAVVMIVAVDSLLIAMTIAVAIATTEIATMMACGGTTFGDVREIDPRWEDAADLPTVDPRHIEACHPRLVATVVGAVAQGLARRLVDIAPGVLLAEEAATRIVIGAAAMMTIGVEVRMVTVGEEALTEKYIAGEGTIAAIALEAPILKFKPSLANYA